MALAEPRQGELSSKCLEVMNERTLRWMSVVVPATSVVGAASESLDLDEVAPPITRNVTQALTADAAGVALVSEEDGELRLVAQSGLPGNIADAGGGLGPHRWGG